MKSQTRGHGNGHGLDRLNETERYRPRSHSRQPQTRQPSLAWSFRWLEAAADNAVASAALVYEFAPGNYTYTALKDAMALRTMLGELERKACQIGDAP